MLQVLFSSHVKSIISGNQQLSFRWMNHLSPEANDKSESYSLKLLFVDERLRA